MPRNVRNFWLKLYTDGRRTPIATGPRNKHGGFSLEILLRENGDIGPTVRITGRCIDNKLVLDVDDGNETVFSKQVER